MKSQIKNFQIIHGCCSILWIKFYFLFISIIPKKIRYVFYGNYIYKSFFRIFSCVTKFKKCFLKKVGTCVEQHVCLCLEWRQFPKHTSKFI